MSFFFTEISDGSSSSSFAYTTSESFFSSSGGEEYEWSQGFELVPGHVSLQLTKKRDRVSRYDVWEHEELEDPVEHPYSVVQVDVTMIQSQCYVFLKNMVSVCEEAEA